MKITPKERFYKKFFQKASSYLQNKDKSNRLLKNAVVLSAKKKGSLNEVWEKLQLLIELFKAYINGQYREIPTKSILSVIAALLYFVSPIDAIPDFLLGFGYIDDAAVIAFTVRQISKDLDSFKLWKEKNEQDKNTILDAEIIQDSSKKDE
ncbi:DUF1232 domain-containing protein [Bacillus sp. RG28]|uniref:DUF1232 domain-containing protein n=1 Tax=Gottfriedia endophytica TaxID=2820819 RepID=A0A940NI72_9BACI|nr:YkvA family protein [Gottfriedia endophytica]MBP0725844.1 DUF1232 domain-containing protein [Gottfriedia endophytica]